MNTPLTRALVLLQTWLTDPAKGRNERGSVSTEQAVITAAVVLLAIAIGAAITAYAQGKIALLG